MEIGYFAVGIGPTVAPEWVSTVATTAERLGFSTICAPEHVVLLRRLRPFPLSPRNGRVRPLTPSFAEREIGRHDPQRT